MNRADRWLLPEGVEDLLPEQAERLEWLRRQLVDLFQRWGYRLVIPPLVEYLESLLTGTAEDLDLQTLKVVDQRNGRLMGVRADMTPQVARIDAHRMRVEGINRLCYIGPVLLARGRALDPNRSPIQVGAELFGHRGHESDLEVMELMLAALEAAAVGEVVLDLGHVGLFRALAEVAEFPSELEAAVFDALQRKAVVELEGLLQENEPAVRSAVLALADLVGGVEVIQRARAQLGAFGEGVTAALDELERVSRGLLARRPGVRLSLDLGELRGFHYHTGLVFAAYRASDGRALALGGRYDHVGEVFGRARPATGFSMDLRQLAECSTLALPPSRPISAPWSDDPDLHRQVEILRAQGRTVVFAPAAQTPPRRARLEHVAGQWRLIEEDEENSAS